MAIEILWWAMAINAVLFIRVLLTTHRALKVGSEAHLLQQQASLLWAEVEREKLKRGVADADCQREMRIQPRDYFEPAGLNSDSPAKED